MKKPVRLVNSSSTTIAKAQYQLKVKKMEGAPPPFLSLFLPSNNTNKNVNNNGDNDKNEMKMRVKWELESK